MCILQDNMFYAFALPERVKACMQTSGQVALNTSDVRSLLVMKAIWFPAVVVTIVAWSQYDWADPISRGKHGPGGVACAFYFNAWTAVLEVAERAWVRVEQGEPTAAVAKHFCIDAVATWFVIVCAGLIAMPFYVDGLGRDGFK